MKIIPTFNAINQHKQLLKEGEIVQVEILEDKNSDYTVKIKNIVYKANFTEEPGNNKVINVEVKNIRDGGSRVTLALLQPEDRSIVIKISPSLNSPEGSLIKVEVINKNGDFYLLKIGSHIYKCESSIILTSTFTAEITSSSEIIPIKYDSGSLIRNLILSSQAEATGILPSSLDLSEVNLTSEELKTAIINSGLFFEHKLLKQINMAEDSTYRALLSGYNTASDEISDMQNINLLSGGLLAFLAIEDIETEILLRIRKEPQGTSIHFKAVFSKIGETIVSIYPVSYSGMYRAVVKTESDISSLLENVDIAKLNIVWKKIDAKSKNVFDIEKDAKARSGFSTMA